MRSELRRPPPSALPLADPRRGPGRIVPSARSSGRWGVPAALQDTRAVVWRGNGGLVCSMFPRPEFIERMSRAGAAPWRLFLCHPKIELSPSRARCCRSSCTAAPAAPAARGAGGLRGLAFYRSGCAGRLAAVIQKRWLAPPAARRAQERLVALRIVSHPRSSSKRFSRCAGSRSSALSCWPPSASCLFDVHGRRVLSYSSSTSTGAPVSPACKSWLRCQPHGSRNSPRPRSDCSRCAASPQRNTRPLRKLSLPAVVAYKLRCRYSRSPLRH